MCIRTSKVNSVNVLSLGSSSTLQIGDSEEIHSITHALAVQRQKELFFGNEGNMDTYSVFHRLYPLSETVQPVHVQRTSLQPTIKVDSLHVLAFSSSAILHIGNTHQISTDTRIKHIRELNDVDKQKDRIIEEE